MGRLGRFGTLLRFGISRVRVVVLLKVRVGEKNLMIDLLNVDGVDSKRSAVPRSFRFKFSGVLQALWQNCLSFLEFDANFNPAIAFLSTFLLY